MHRPMSHFVDLAAIARAQGLQPRSFVPIAPAPAVEYLEDLDPAAAIATIHLTAGQAGAGGRTLTVTVAMLRAHIATTVAEHARRLASWLAVAHLYELATDPEYLR